MKRAAKLCLGATALAWLGMAGCRDGTLAGPGSNTSGPLAGNALADTMTIPDTVTIPDTSRHDTLPQGGGARILIDASRDGGVWWFPQWAGSGGFDPQQPHQGQMLADALRAAGYMVRELPRPYPIRRALLDSFDIVIRAGMFGSYESAEVVAYREWVRDGGRLLLLADHMANEPGTPDSVANAFGLPFQGILVGGVTLAGDTLTEGVGWLAWLAGSGLPSWPDSAVILARGASGSYLDLDNSATREAGEPAEPALLGRMNFGAGRIVFCGDLNLWEWVPQPLLGNVLAWLASGH